MLECIEEKQILESEKPWCACGCGLRVNSNKRNGGWYDYRLGHKLFPVPKEPPPKCNCGCNKDVKWNNEQHHWNEYVRGHNGQTHGERIKSESESPPLCKCGCGLPVFKSVRSKGWNVYINGHYWHDDNVRMRASELIKKRYESVDYCEKRRESIIKAFESHPEFKEQRSRAQKNSYKEKPMRRIRQSIAHKKRYKDPDAIERISQAQKKSYKEHPERRERQSKNSRQVYIDNPELRRKQSERAVLNWQNPEYIAKVFGNHKAGLSSKPEQIINSLTPENVRYVGNGQWHRKITIHTKDGQVITKHKCPDFKVTGLNKVIEVHGDYWHKGEDVDALIQAYKDQGIECLVIWEHEIYEDIQAVLNRIADFLEQDNWQMTLAI